jgi:hypothetical protein
VSTDKFNFIEKSFFYKSQQLARHLQQGHFSKKFVKV